MNLTQTPRVAIIGADLPVSSAARRLVEAGIEAELFDKSRGVSGRVATRRLEFRELALRFDHGSPFLTLSQFQAIQTLTNSLNTPPDPAPLDFRTHSELDDEPVISITTGINQVGKSLAKGLKIHLSYEVTEILPSDGNRRWKIVAKDAVVIDDFDWVITTVPPRQAAEILRTNSAMVERPKSHRT